MSTPSNNGTPLERLTTEESDRIPLIRGGIKAISSKAMPARLKPLAETMMYHAGWGQGVCWASCNTLGAETGYSGMQVRRQVGELVDLGWFVFVGRHAGNSKHALPEYAPSARMVAHLRAYFASSDAAEAEEARRRYPHEVDHQVINPRASKVDHQVINLSPSIQPQEVDHSGPEVDHSGAEVDHFDPISVVEVDHQVIDKLELNGLENRFNSPPPLTPPPRGENGGGGGTGRQETPARRLGGGRKKDRAPSTQSQWRDLSVIPSEQWTSDENDLLCYANGLGFGNEAFNEFDAVLVSRWVELMDIAGGRLELIKEVVWHMGDRLEAGRPIDSPMGYLLSVLEQRARPKTKTVAAMMDREKPEQRPVLIPAPKPVELTDDEKEALRQQAAENARKTAEAIQRVQEQVAEAQRLPRRPVFQIGGRT